MCRNNKRYYSFNKFLRDWFGFRVEKISIDAGFTCPNRDGKTGYGGCIYCYNPGFVSPLSDSRKTVRQQIELGKSRQRKKKFKGKYLAYFQAFSNTYAPVDTLKRLYDDALADEEVVGISIGTRPDCVSEEVISLLEDYAKKYMVWLEYGLQSIHQKTLKFLNRGHDYGQFEYAVKLAQNRGIFICAHIILGLPGEGEDEIHQTVKKIGDLKIDGIKIHHLQVVKGTVLEEKYRKQEIKIFSPDEYIELVCNLIEILPPRIVIHRLIGDIRPDLLIAPRWDLSKTQILEKINQELKQRNTCQGYFADYERRDSGSDLR